MTAKYCVSHIGIPVVALIAFLLSGCASMTSSNEELRSIGESEGIVVGSVLLTVAQGDANESGWAFLKGRKAGELEYSVAISETGFNPLKATYTLPAIPGKEAFFVKKLPVGNYTMGNIGPTGFLAPQLTFPLGLSFTVKPQKINYIGKLVVTLPDRIGGGGRFGFTIQDAQQETIDKLRNDYPSIVPNAVKELAGRDQGPNIVPGNTGSSPLLQRDTLTVINAIDGAYDTTCAKRTIVNTEIVKGSTSADVTVQERWTMDRCGKTIPYLVTFTPGTQGGTDIGVKQER
ncbi:MAG: hypothetical protein WA373_14690 [Burkholderiales bacterium]